MEKKPLQYTYSYGQIEILEERLALAAIPLGPELQVNTYTTNTQSASVAAMDASGNAVIVWISERQNAGIRGIYGQRFDSSGMAVGGEFLIDESTSNSPDVAMTPTGEFIVTWSFRPIQTSSFEVYAKRFNAAGVQQGSAFQVNSYSLGDQRSSRIAMDDAGNFVIAWESEYQDGSSSGIYARRYNAVGTPLGAEFRVNTTTTHSQSKAQIAMDVDGDFVVGWSSQNQDGNLSGVYAQRFNAAGVKQGSEFQVNTYTTFNQQIDGVAMDAAGNFAILFTGPPGGIQVQRYTASGNTIDDVLIANTQPLLNGGNAPSMAMQANGDFIVSWTNDVAGTRDVYAQRFRADGVRYGDEFRVNSYVTSDQSGASVAIDVDGDFLITWKSNYQDGGQSTPGSGGSVHAQFYSKQLEPIASISAPPSAVRGATVTVVLAAQGTPTIPGQTFDYEIDWDGDGIFDESMLDGADNVTVAHVFPTSGNYDIRVKVTDSSGMDSATAVSTISVVDWALVTDPEESSKLDLHWGGTAGIDAYGFLPGGFVLIQAQNNQFFGTPQIVSTGSFNGKIYVYAQASNDLVFADVMTQSLVFFGGDGDDVLVGGRGGDYLDGGRGNDILLGGTLSTDGDDTILGGEGDDLIVGHWGADFLSGDSGVDLVMAGSLFFSNLPNAVYAIQAEWLSGRSYADRIANLTGTGAGPRNNGGYYLLPADTALDDGLVDQVLGGDDRDWWLVDVETDALLDLELDETVTDLVQT